MSAPASVEELIQLIRKSGMVEEAKVTAYMNRRQMGRGLPADPREATDGMINDGILTNFQAEQFLLGKWRGFTIGKYKLLERIGVGGMGQVFLCEHIFMKRRVAIKVLPPAKAEQPAALGRFYREARAAGSLEHPNIVRTHDIDQDGNLHFIVMEYVDGCNMLEIVKKHGPMQIHRAVHYVNQVANGLDFAFKSGIIHRDIKPGNILIDRRGTTRILDMGLARFYNDQSDMLTVKYDDKIVLGTADYVAPEQVANSHSVDVRADIYALGATLYFLLAGHPPFPTGTVSQKLLWHRTKEPTPIRQIRAEVPDELAQIVARMMAKDPALRFQTPADVKAALQPYLQGRIPVPTPAEMPQLCPAIAEIVEMYTESPTDEQNQEQEDTASSAVPLLAHAGAPAMDRRVAQPSKAFASPFGATPVNPFGGSGPAPALRPSAVAKAAPRPATRPEQPQTPFGLSPTHPQQPSPFRDSHQQVHNPATQSHPANCEVRQQSRLMPQTRTQQVALYVVLGLSILLGGGIIGWKLFQTQKPFPQTDVKQPASTP